MSLNSNTTSPRPYHHHRHQSPPSSASGPPTGPPRSRSRRRTQSPAAAQHQQFLTQQTQPPLPNTPLGFESPQIPTSALRYDSPLLGTKTDTDEGEISASMSSNLGASAPTSPTIEGVATLAGSSLLLSSTSSVSTPTSMSRPRPLPPQPSTQTFAGGSAHALTHQTSLKSMASAASLSGLPTSTGGPNSGGVRRQAQEAAAASASARPSSRRPSATGLRSVSSNAGDVSTLSVSGTKKDTKPTTPSEEKFPEKEKEKDKENVKETTTTTTVTKKEASSSGKAQEAGRIKYRNTPHLPHSTSAERVPSAMMYWSRAPVHGALPTRNMRAHTVTVVDNIAWVFGGCDEKGCWRDVWCFDIETFQWSHPEMLGELPPPCRAHTATLVDRKIYIFGGGEGPVYYNDVYVLDTVTHRWHKPNIQSPLPLPRRAHTAVLEGTKIYIFGGGNGHRALNDLWCLDVSVGLDKLKWEAVGTTGAKPASRGYHTANLVGGVMIVVGGSDGRECFDDVWILYMDNLEWRKIRLDKTYKRLSHSSIQVGSYLFIMGGHDGSKYSNELLLFNLVTQLFETRATQGRPPSARGYHVTVLADSRLWSFGGFDGHTVFDDVWILDLAAAAYLPQVTSFNVD
ncbi:hypothetical protein FRC02_008340 [Tulasnella sp. 418]|nr:hypothetical protein FRC02_008340 [Tulasnella sp. 418]